VKVRVVSDTACDLPEQLAEQLGVLLVPLHIRFGTTELVDRLELSSKEFWQRCAASEVFPETAAPSPGAFHDAFEELVRQGASGIVCVTLSSRLSATNQSAAQAGRETKGAQVAIVDSLSVTLGEGLVVLAAAEAAARGDELSSVVAAAESARERLRVFGAISTLENLRKGGRIGGAAAALGTLLSIKPVIEVRGGVVEQESKQRTRAKSLRYLADKARSAGPLERLAAMGADAPDFDEFVAMLAGIPTEHPLLVGDIGPVIGAHAGPGAVGVAWVSKKAARHSGDESALAVTR
jgi:DegV family protein with EDD domain